MKKLEKFDKFSEKQNVKIVEDTSDKRVIKIGLDLVDNKSGNVINLREY